MAGAGHLSLQVQVIFPRLRPRHGAPSVQISSLQLADQHLPRPPGAWKQTSWLPGPPPSFAWQAEPHVSRVWPAGGRALSTQGPGSANMLGVGWQHARQVPTQVPCTNHHLVVLAWGSMYGVLAYLAVLQVWRESDDVVPSPSPSRCSTTHKCTGPQSTACTHATPAALPPLVSPSPCPSVS